MGREKTMKKAFFIVTILFVAVISTACINNMAVQELNNTAKSYMDKGDYQAAIERLESSIELDNTIYETHYNLGVAYIDAREYEKAINSLNNALHLNSKYANAYYTLAVAQEKLADSLINSDVHGLTTNDDGQTEQVRTSGETYKNISNSIKEQMIERYLTSIDNYRKYIEMVNSPQRTEEVNSHIEEMEKVLTQLGYTGSTF